MSQHEFFRMSRVNDNKQGPNSYYSCRDLEGSVTFLHGHLTMCCHVHNTNKGMPYISEYTGGKIPVQAILDARQELIRKNQTDEDTPCKGCEFLEKRDWEKSKYLIDNVSIGHYTPCNLRCNYCYITDYSPEESKKFNTPPYDMAEALQNIVDQDLLSPKSTAWLSGGEPTTFVDFEETMKILVKNHVKTTLGTNCTIRPIEIVREGVANGLVEILCSVDAGTRDKYTEVKGKNRFDDVWKILEEYLQINDENIVVKYIFMQENISNKEVYGFLDMCKSKGVKKISISRDVRQHKGVLSALGDEMPKGMYEAIVLMYKEAVKCGIRVYFDINWPVFKDEEIAKIKALANNAL